MVIILRFLLLAAHLHQSFILAEQNNKNVSLLPVTTPLILKYLYYIETNSSHADGAYPIRDIMVDLVNRNTSMLSAYKVSIEIFDTLFNTDFNLGRTIDLFMKHVAHESSSSQVVALLSTMSKNNACDANCYMPKNALHAPAPLYFGPEYSSECQVIAQLAPFYNLVQISSQSNSPTLADRVKYPNFFRTTMSSNAFLAIPRALMNYFNYTRAALVSFDETYAYEPLQKIDFDLHSHNFDVLFNLRYRPGVNDTVDHVLSSITLFDARIIFIWSNTLDDYRLYCRAMDDKSNSIQPGKHLIISLGLTDPVWVVEPSRIVDRPACTREKLARMTNGSFLVWAPKWGPLNDALDFGSTAAEFISQAEYIGRTRYNHSTGRLNRFAPMLIDGFWLAFLALDGVDRKLRSEKPSRALTDFTFASSDIAAMLRDQIRKTQFRGAGGNIGFTASGEINAQISIYQYRPNSSAGAYLDVFRWSTEKVELELVNKPVFLTANGEPPPDREPVIEISTADAGSGIVTILLVVGCAGLACIIAIGMTLFVLYKQKMRAKQLANPVWLIDPSALIMRYDSYEFPMASSPHGQSATTMPSVQSKSMGTLQHSYSGLPATTATLDDQIVCLQSVPLNASRLKIDLSTHKTLSDFRDKISHPNVVRFIGYCSFSSSSPSTTAMYKTTSFFGEDTTVEFNQYLVWEFCEKGSLEHLIENYALKIDSLFEYAIMIDIAQGMTFLHKSFVHIHGALCAAACVTDRRFSIKIAAYSDNLLAPLFGLPALTPQGDNSEESKLTMSLYSERRLYWSPELLRKAEQQADDIYAYAITIHVLLTREAPFESSNLSAREVLELVRQQPNKRVSPFRPAHTPELLNRCDKRLLHLLQQCWAEQPNERPSFGEVQHQLQLMLGVKSSSSSVTDQLLRRLESYAHDMESLVRERTRELINEKRRSDKLLNAILPPEIAEELKVSGQVQPELFDSVSIYFSDIVNFTTLASNSTPIEVINLLNTLYTKFDSVIDSFDAYKVETIGDAYMVASGLPKRNGRQRNSEIAHFALALLAALQDFVIPHRAGELLQIRIGLHTGPCVAGVVGTKMPRYWLFGDTVNTASRMESTGQPLRIHMSEAMKLALDEAEDNFSTEIRGKLEVKGKGTMWTYWLLGNDVFTILQRKDEPRRKSSFTS